MKFRVQFRAEAQNNIREAICLHIESLSDQGDPIPPGIHEDVIEVPAPRDRVAGHP